MTYKTGIAVFFRPMIIGTVTHINWAWLSVMIRFLLLRTWHLKIHQELFLILILNLIFWSLIATRWVGGNAFGSLVLSCPISPLKLECFTFHYSVIVMAVKFMNITVTF